MRQFLWILSPTPKQTRPEDYARYEGEQEWLRRKIERDARRRERYKRKRLDAAV